MELLTHAFFATITPSLLSKLKPQIQKTCKQEITLVLVIIKASGQAQ